MTSTVSKVDIAYLHLRELIVNADLMPGTSASEHALASTMRAQAIDIRAAVARLETEGLTMICPSGGFAIAPIPLEEVVSQARQISVLEARAAYVSALNGPTPIALSALSDAAITMQEALLRNEPLRWARASHHFHRSLVQCSARPRLISAALALSEPLHRVRMVAMRLDGPPQESAKQCRDLVEAIRNGDAAEAYDLHLDRWREQTRSFLDLLSTNGMHRFVPLQITAALEPT